MTPDTSDEIPNVPELGGAIGRRASFACRQGQHDLCDDPPLYLGDVRIYVVGRMECDCRCHE